MSGKSTSNATLTCFVLVDPETIVSRGLLSGVRLTIRSVVRDNPHSSKINGSIVLACINDLHTLEFTIS